MAQRNTLQYIILGLLSQAPRTGYELTQDFAHEIGEFWQAQHSQIYPLLGKMEAQGLIAHTVEVTGTKLEKKRYRNTAEGQAVLTAWVGSPTPTMATTKDEFVLKLYFVQRADDTRLPGMIKEQLRIHREWLQHLEARRQLLFADPDAASQQFGHYLILDHALTRERQYVQWLEEQLARLPHN
ncbi:PadR family transcriptional regulator [Lacticaseibacillus thailandensis]|uniref:Regulator of phenolic acid metabolism PadR n=1 Tax=Lacticaseibacillus thailandensis DSM 22698 = JCM 13996 TaxID=1423810 RepID=A0A0R2C4N3_9LACO|nr:PadR family transcriptional regulator [Lacticaseibacillus thailandensis]KRM86685.1 regulator of phenolic acid metabolism PadR [Lacticaseibacillus thailandensis DSM 22698 = JCM 13996]